MSAYTCPVLILVLMVATPAFTVAASDEVFLLYDDTQSLSSVLFGSGMEGVTPAHGDTPTIGGRVTWQRYRDQVDHLGMRHVFYRQVFTPVSGTTTARMVGGSLGLHFDREGELTYVWGRQFDDIPAASVLRAASADQALTALRAALTRWPGFSCPDWTGLDPRRLRRIMDRAQVTMESSGHGQALRWVWRFQVPDATGEHFFVRLDGDTLEVLSVLSATQANVCEPDTEDSVDAVVIPQNPALPDRSAEATDATSRPAPYDYEAHWVGDGSIPDIEVYVGNDTDAGCAPQGPELYRLVSLKDVNGQPTYRGFTFGGSSHYRNKAGDAIYHTRHAMETVFWQLQYNGSWSKARVVVDATDCYGTQDNAYFLDDREDWAPEQSVAICSVGDSQNRYSLAAALDVVAHEWGHRLVLEMSVFDTYYRDGKQLNEGFADLLGHIAEWDHHPWRDGQGQLHYGGNPPWNLDCDEHFEEFDWCAGEDFHKGLEPGRRVDRYCDVPWNEKTWTLHAEEEYSSTYGHQPGGNRLSVALYLLATGGCNPICGGGNRCGRPPGWPSECSGCDVSVAALEQFEHAAKILFRALYYLPEDAGWEDLDQAGMFAANDLYRGQFPPHAMAYQQAVADAFEAIGYHNTPPCFIAFGELLCLE